MGAPKAHFRTSETRVPKQFSRPFRRQLFKKGLKYMALPPSLPFKFTERLTPKQDERFASLPFSAQPEQS
ncbi:unnamed protein product [Hymenolepis diminuta]|uniref:TPX2_importin domain-containing protein n=1 Tax=Hymenolepis diminuta TaxID=6216 RepID=A0A0R3SDE5_HYMDI|nr:unnamed protein product [Hymenolepis diminuta]